MHYWEQNLQIRLVQVVEKTLHTSYSEVRQSIKYSTIEDCIATFDQWNTNPAIRAVIVYEPFMFSVWNKFKASLPGLENLCRKAVKQIVFVSIINDFGVVQNLRSMNPAVQVAMLCCLKDRHFLLEGIIDGHQNPVTPEQMKSVLSLVHASDWVGKMENLDPSAENHSLNALQAQADLASPLLPKAAPISMDNITVLSLE